MSEFKASIGDLVLLVECDSEEEVEYIVKDIKRGFYVLIELTSGGLRVMRPSSIKSIVKAPTF